MYEGLKNITMHQLETFYYLLEERSFVRTAKRMFISQPAVTRQIKNLEEIVGAALIQRDSKGLNLTAEGKVLYEYAKRILKLREEAKDKVAQLHSNAGGMIYISASTIPSAYILPYVLSDFFKSHPQIRVHIQTAASDEAIELVLGGQGEVGFVGKNPLNQRLHAEPIWRDRLILAVGRGHKWQGKSSVTIAELKKEPLVMRERGSATREIVERSLKEIEAPSLGTFRIVCEVDSSEAAKEAVIAGVGVSIISFHAVARELAGGLVEEVPVEGLNIERSFYLIWRRQFALPPQHESFVRFVRAHRGTDETAFWSDR